MGEEMSEPLDYIYRLAELDLNVCVCEIVLAMFHE